MKKQHAVTLKNLDLPIPIVIGLALPILFLSFFYFTYAQNAWFFQDDFGFISHYANSLQSNQLLDFSNFGRFFSRNIYWNYGIKFFSFNAQYFYLFNFFVILATSFIIYKVVSDKFDNYGGLVAGLFYFSLPATVESYSWLSNSQHILGHFFVVLFVFLYARYDAVEGRYRNALKILSMLLVLILGFYSNIFMSMVLSLPIWMLFANENHRKEKSRYFIVLLGVVIFCYFYTNLSRQQVGVYAASYSVETLIKNANYYFESIVIAILWLISIVAGATYSYCKKQFLVTWFFIASVAFFMPFAFLAHQRYGQYAELTFLFYLLGIWSLALESSNNKWPSLVRYFGLFMVLFILVKSLEPPIRYFSENPRGRSQKNQIELLRLYDLNHPNVKKYCFRSDKLVENKTGVKVWEIPGDWWFTGFGTAFSIFVNSEKTFELSPGSSQCDVVFIFKNETLEQSQE